MDIIVTGGAGFIGSNFIFHMLKKYPDYRIICLDKLTYTGNLSTLESAMSNPNFRFYHPNDESGMVWNDPEIGITWPQLVGEYKGSASAEGYTLEDGTALNLSDKDQKWLGLKDTFKF